MDSFSSSNQQKRKQPESSSSSNIRSSQQPLSSSQNETQKMWSDDLHLNDMCELCHDYKSHDETMEEHLKSSNHEDRMKSFSSTNQLKRKYSDLSSSSYIRTSQQPSTSSSISNRSVLSTSSLFKPPSVFKPANSSTSLSASQNETNKMWVDDLDLNDMCELCHDYKSLDESMEDHLKSSNHEDRMKKINMQNIDNWIEKQQCNECYIFFENNELMETHINSESHRNGVEKVIRAYGGSIIKSALNRKFVVYESKNTTPTVFVDDYLRSQLELLVKIINYHILLDSTVKIQLQLICLYGKGVEGEEGYTIAEIGHHNKTTPVYPGTNLPDLLSDLFNDLHHKSLNYERGPSGFYIKDIKALQIAVTKIDVLSGGSFKPEFDIKHKGVICPRNMNDMFCFKWCIVMGLTCKVRKIAHKERVSQYKVRINESQIYLPNNNITLNFTDLEFPMKLNMISKFEENNPDISINIFGYNREKAVATGPFYITKQEKTHHFNLLLLEHNGEYHFSIIIKLAR